MVTKDIWIFRDRYNRDATVFYRSQVCILVKNVLSEGMGSRIPIKIAGKSKVTK